VATSISTNVGKQNRTGDRPQMRSDPLWNVLLWNDQVNTRPYVVFTLQRVFGHSSDMATKLMAETEQSGKAVVATEMRELAEMHAAQLHGYGLQSTIAEVI